MIKLNSKLSLKKEKISVLEADELDKVYGGKNKPQTKGDGDGGGTQGLCCSDDEASCKSCMCDDDQLN